MKRGPDQTYRTFVQFLRPRLFCLLPLAFAPLLPPTAAASEPELYGPGTRAPALGGTGISYGDDFEATYENPAGLVFGHTRRLVVGFAAGRTSLAIDGQPHSASDTNGLFLGAQLPLPLGGVMEGRLTLGLLMYLPTNVVNRAQNPFSDVPALSLLDNRTQTVSVTIGAGARISRSLSLGVGVLALAALVGSIDLQADAAGHFTAQSNEQLTASYAPIAGVRFDPAARWHLGASFRGASLSRYDITVRSDLAALLHGVLALPTLHLGGVSQYDPLEAGAEVSFSPSPRWLIALGLTYARWSAMPPPVDPVTPTPDFAPRPGMPDFRDVAIPRAGVEWQRAEGALRTTLRAGYFFAPSPARDDPQHSQLDAHRHVFGGGLAIDYENAHAPLHFSSFVQWHQLQSGGRATGSIAVVGLSLGADL